jgi:hypothetical protein
MAPVLQFFQDSGTLTSGRGAVTTEVDNWNMKDSNGLTTLYYPHDAATCAPLIRPTLAGDLKLSYKIYTFFKISGTYTKIKNLKLKISIDDAAQASGGMLYYKLTNVYQTPDNAWDGQMLPAYTGSAFANGASDLVLWPNWSAVGPDSATSRNMFYGPDATLYSAYLVTQLYIQNSTLNSDVGNTAEFKLRMEFIEFGA